VGERSKQAISLHDLQTVLRDLDRSEDALAVLAEVTPLHAELGNVELELECWLNIAEISIDRRQCGAAQNALEVADKLLNSAARDTQRFSSLRARLHTECDQSSGQSDVSPAELKHRRHLQVLRTSDQHLLLIIT
jgi:hypothetical protein